MIEEEEFVPEVFDHEPSISENCPTNFAVASMPTLGAVYFDNYEGEAKAQGNKKGFHFRSFSSLVQSIPRIKRRTKEWKVTCAKTGKIMFSSSQGNSYDEVVLVAEAEKDLTGVSESELQIYRASNNRRSEKKNKSFKGKGNK